MPRSESPPTLNNVSGPHSFHLTPGPNRTNRSLQDVQAALHAADGITWGACNMDVNINWSSDDRMANMQPIYSYLV